MWSTQTWCTEMMAAAGCVCVVHEKHWPGPHVYNLYEYLYINRHIHAVFPCQMYLACLILANLCMGIFFGGKFSCKACVCVCMFLQTFQNSTIFCVCNMLLPVGSAPHSHIFLVLSNQQGCHTVIWDVQYGKLRVKYKIRV